MTFDKQKTTGLNCGIVGIPASKFDSLEHREVYHPTSDIVGGFFVPFFHQLVGWVQEALSLLGSLCDQSVNLHSIRLFSFDSEFGGNKSQRGAMMSTTPQAKSATTPQEKAFITKIAIKELEEDMLQLQTLYYTIENELAPKHKGEDSPCHDAWMLCKLANNTLSNLSSLNLIIINNNEGVVA